jgi:HEAT repeat protein
MRLPFRFHELRTLIAIIIAIGLPGPLTVNQAFADGCFVFKWDKQTDINEPTQKAIIVHDADREDLLLQVKYEGPLNEFGWLVPVPSVPTIQKGSMEAFYELSQLTQSRFGVGRASESRGLTAPNATGGAEPVKVITIKTVGAYEVAVLSARDSGSLTRWLESHGYSLPDEKTGIVDDYIRKGWYFVAAKIQLNKPVTVNITSGSAEKASKSSSQERTVVQRKLATGELHPLLISFDTPACVFPLKISAVGGHPSEVSLYILSAQPLLNQFLFDEGCKKLEQSRAEWDANRTRREQQRQQSAQNLEVLQLAWMAHPNGDFVPYRGNGPNPSIEEFKAMAAEMVQPNPDNSLEDYFYTSPNQFLQCLQVDPEQISKTAETLPRLKGKRWFLTKNVRTFTPAEMRDLEFVPAVPAIANLLPRPIGREAAQVLTQFGSNSVPVLLSACKSKNRNERMNGASGFERIQDRQAVEPLLNLFLDENPQVRFCAIRAGANNWDRRFREPLIAFFRDPHQEIRSEAIMCLSQHEDKSRTDAYLALLNDADPNVQLCAACVLLQINPDAIPPQAFAQMIKSSNSDVQCAALNILFKLNRDIVSRDDLLPLLRVQRRDTVMVAMKLIEGNGYVKPQLPEPDASEREREEKKRWLSSAEAAPLMTNQLGVVRLAGLKIMERNADARAIEETLPLLKDKYSIVRKRAVAVLKTTTGKDFPETNPDAWEEWWAANKTTFGVNGSAR